MSQGGRSQLSVQGFGPDALWYQAPQNVFDYRPYFCGDVYVTEDFDISPSNSQSTQTASNTTEIQWKFEIDKRADLLGGIEIIQPRTAVTVATTPAFDDFEGYATIKEIRFIYNNKVFWKSWGEVQYMQLMQEGTDKERSAEAKAQFGMMTDIERQVQAATASCWTARIRVPWEAQHAKIPMCAMPNKIQVEVDFNSPSKCCRVASGSCTVTYNQPTLRCHWYHVPQARRAELFDMVNNPSGQGVAIKMTDYEFHKRESVAASSGQQKIKLSNIKNSIIKLNIMLRAQASLDTQTTLDLWNFSTQCARFWLQEGGTRIGDIFEWNDSTDGSTAANYLLYNINNKLHPDGVVGFNVATMPFLHLRNYVGSKYDCLGSRYFNKYTNPELVLEFDSAPSASYLDVYAERHQLMLYSIGEIRVTLY